jgi:hypothetical protein
VENLSIRCDLADERLVPLIQAMPLKRLCSGLHPRISLPGSITHFEFFGSIRSGEGPAFWSHLGRMPLLTHLCIHDQELLWQGAGAFLETHTQLKVLMLYCHDSLPFTTLHEYATHVGKDPRLIMLFHNDIYFWLEDWKMGALLGVDYWSKGEIVIEGRKYHREGDIAWEVDIPCILGL